MPKIKYRKGSKKHISKPLVANPTTDFLRLFYGGTVFGVPVTTSTLTSWSDSSPTLPPEPELRTDLFIYKGGQKYAIRAEGSSTNWNNHSDTHSDSHSDSHNDTPHTDIHGDYSDTWNDSAISSKHADYNAGSWYNHWDQSWIGSQGTGTTHENATVNLHSNSTWPGTHSDTWTNNGGAQKKDGYHFDGYPWTNSGGGGQSPGEIHFDFTDIYYYYFHNDIAHQDSHGNSYSDWGDYTHSDWGNHSNSWQRLEESI